MLVIGITGRIGSGKSEIACHLIENHGFKRAKFATGLKIMIHGLLLYRGVPENEVERYLEGDLKELPTPYLNGQSPRHAMITLGTEWGRNLMHPDLWVDTEAEALKAVGRTFDRVLFDDVRFPNEVAAIRRLGGVIWRVERPGAPKVEHESENLQVDPDALIGNHGSLSELYGLVDLLTLPRGVIRMPGEAA